MLGVPVDDVTMEETLDVIDAMIATRRVHQHVVVNVSKVVQASRDPGIRAILDSCDLVNVDGQPVIWASRLLGHGLRERVPGVDLMQHLIARAAVRGYGVFLLGARGDVVTAVERRIRREHPGLHIAGARHGYWEPADEAGIADAVAASGADILFLAIGSPAKEQFLARWKDSMSIPLVMGVGGSFDVYAGRTKRAPGWMQRAGLEWLYRVLQEPRRLWYRYLSDAPQFAWLVVRARMQGD